MTTCWDILELDNATADASAVKRAYARLLKQNRPDRDPEGFRRLNQAFEEAKFELQLREHGIVFHTNEGTISEEEKVPFADISTTSQIATPPIVADSVQSTEFQSRRTAVAEALAAGSPEQIRPAFSAWLDLLQTDPSCIKAWASATLALAETHGEQVFLGVPNSVLLLELEHDQADLTHRMLESHIRDCDTAFLTWLGDAILTKEKNLDSLATTGVAIRVAAHLAVSNLPLSQRLLDYCFPRLRGFAANGIAHVEFLQANAAPISGVFAGKGKQFIGNVLASPNDQHDWQSEGGDLALRQINTGAYRGWPGFAILKEVSSDPRLTALIRRFESGPSARSSRSSRKPARQDHAAPGGFRWWPFLVAFLVIKLLIVVGQQSSRSTSPFDRPELQSIDRDDPRLKKITTIFPTSPSSPTIPWPVTNPTPSDILPSKPFSLEPSEEWSINNDTSLAVPDGNGGIQILVPPPAPSPNSVPQLAPAP